MFTPRQFSSAMDGTAFLHYKDPTEKDGEGSTTFPPTRSPIVVTTTTTTDSPIVTKTGWFQPTLSPSRVPTKHPVTFEPTGLGETRHPTQFPTPNPTKEPTPNPSGLPTKEPTKEPTKLPTKEPTRNPTKFPTPNPSKGPTKEPTKDVSLI